jgi:large subunit ribosomal protein L22
MGKSATPRMLKDNEAIAKHTSIRTSPQKLNLVAGMIRGMNVADALAALTFCKRRVSGEVKKVLMSAIANAENNHNLDIDKLYVTEASVGKALVMKRFQPRAKGRASRIVKPFSNMRIVVREREETA